MQDVAGESFPCLRYCYAISVKWLPEEVLCADRHLYRLSVVGGKCFARVLQRTSWNSFQIRVAAEGRHLDDEKQSHLVEVPASALPSDVRSDSLIAAAIPPLLLDEDAALRHVAEEYGECSFLIECQLSWDLYRIRIAPDMRSLLDERSSHVIYLSQAEMQEYMRFPLKQDTPERDVVAACSVVDPAPQQSIDLIPLEPIDVPEEDIRAAIETVDISGSLPHRSKLGRRIQQIIELILYRAVLRTVAHNKAIQEIVRMVLVARKQFGQRLIHVRHAFENDHHTYWTVQMFVPTDLIRTYSI